MNDPEECYEQISYPSNKVNERSIQILSNEMIDIQIGFTNVPARSYMNLMPFAIDHSLVRFQYPPSIGYQDHLLQVYKHSCICKHVVCRICNVHRCNHCC